MWHWEPTTVDWLAIAAVSVAVFALLGLSEVLKRIGVTSEWSRKTAHIGSGLITLSFPYTFTSIWPVIILSVAFFVIMWVSSRLHIFQGVHGVNRDSVGAFVFPIVIVLVFWLSYGNPVHFAIPVLVLSISDAVAALVGKKYGVRHYHSLGEQRSWEGSFVFWVTAFLFVHVPLLLLTDVGRTECVLIALGCSLLVTTFEMISVRGLDNLFIPYGTWYVLDNYVEYDLIGLLHRVVFMAVMTVFGFYTVKRNLFTKTGAVGAALAIYACFSIAIKPESEAGSMFFIPPAIALLSCVALALRGFKGAAEPMGLSHTFQSMIVMVVLVLVYDNYPNDQLILPFIGACSVSVVFVMSRAFRAHSVQFRVGLSLLSLLAPITASALLPLVPQVSFLHIWLGWLIGAVVLLFALWSLRFRAQFKCEVCGLVLLGRRHCGQPTSVIKGHRWLTEFRICLLANIVAASAGTVAVLW